MKNVIHTSKAPKAIGPYSQAILAGGVVYVSGQLPIDPATSTIVSEDIEQQTRTALSNISAILTEAGLSFENVVKATLFLKDMASFSVVNKVYAEFFSSDCYPARVAIGVAALPQNALIEIDVVAFSG